MGCATHLNRYISEKYLNTIAQCYHYLSGLSKIKHITIAASLSLFTAFPALATCQTVGNKGGGSDIDNAIGLPLYYADDTFVRDTNLPATVNIEDDQELQPNGSLLASTVISADISNKISPEQIIYLCDPADVGELRFFYVSNVQGLYGGGFWATETANGLVVKKYSGGVDGVFQTIAKNVGLRLTVANGEAFSGRWKSIQLTKENYEEYDYKGVKKIAIKAKHIPLVTMELFRVGAPANLSTQTCSRADGPTNTSKINCDIARRNEGEGKIIGTGIGSTGYVEMTRQAAGFITLKGGGLNNNIGNGHPSAVNRSTFAAGYGINNMIRLTRKKSCIVKNVTPVVFFSTITVGELMSGGYREEDFDVEIKCHGTGVKFGFGEFETVMGIRIPLDAYKAAIDEKLSAGGGSSSWPPVTHLLSNRYQTNDGSLARGVGIRIVTSDRRPVKLMGYEGLEAPSDIDKNGFSASPSKYNRLDESGGWLSIPRNANISNEGNYKIYHHRFTGILERLPDKKVTTGKIDATAYIVVQVQ